VFKSLARLLQRLCGKKLKYEDEFPHREPTSEDIESIAYSDRDTGKYPNDMTIQEWREAKKSDL